MLKNKNGNGFIDYKWRFAVGTTSRVPGQRGVHFLMLDIDSVNHDSVDVRLAMDFGCRTFATRSPNGWHIFTDIRRGFKSTCELALAYGADPKWVEIGRNRGYLFLADYKPMKLLWKTERMAIYFNGEREREEALDAGRTGSSVPARRNS